MRFTEENGATSLYLIPAVTGIPVLVITPELSVCDGPVASRLITLDQLYHCLALSGAAALQQ